MFIVYCIVFFYHSVANKKSLTDSAAVYRRGVSRFTYRMLGFERQPVDHYMRTFYVAAERRYAIYRPFCVGSRPRHANMMDWQRQFLDRYADCRKFSFVFHPLPVFQPTRGSLDARPSPRTASLSVQPLLQVATDRQTHIQTDNATLGRLFSLVFHSVPAFQLARGSLDPRDSVPIGHGRGRQTDTQTDRPRYFAVRLSL